MTPNHNLFLIVLLLLVFYTAGALYGHALVRCVFSAPDGHDAVYLEQYFFNKVMAGQYNSTVGKMISYEEKLNKYADAINENPDFMKLMVWKTKRCKTGVPSVVTSLLNPVEPYVRLRLVKAASSKHPGLLMCSVYDFYPKQIKVTWLKNGKEIKSDVTATDELSNGNWLFQIHTDLEYTTRPEEKITCMVEHPSFTKPMFYDWESMTDTDMNKMAPGAAALLFGLLFLGFALIYYKKKHTVMASVPTTENLYPEDTL